MFTVGLTVILAAVEPVDQTYPLYVMVVDKVVLLPLQSGFTVAVQVGVGKELTVIVLLTDPLQPLPSVTVIV